MEKNEFKNMQELMSSIQDATKKQKSSSMSDQIKVQKMMLNDPEYILSVYERRKGKVGERNPREEAVKFVSNISSEITGLDKKTSYDLASKYSFTNKDATFFLNMNHDFNQTYLQTGRKMNVIQTSDSEGSVFLKAVASKSKIVPGKDSMKTTVVPAYEKLVSRSNAPKYINK